MKRVKNLQFLVPTVRFAHLIMFVLILLVVGSFGVFAADYHVVDCSTNPGGLYNISGANCSQNIILDNNITCDIAVQHDALCKSETFTGNLIGNNYTISNLNISCSTNLCGLFARGGSPKFNDIGIIDSVIKSISDLVGSLIGKDAGGVSNSYAMNVKISVDGGGRYVGGLVGYDAGGVSNSYAMDVSISSSGGNAGGLVGYDAGGVSNSYAMNASISGTSYIGGLVGYNAGGVSNSYGYAMNVKISGGSGGHVGGLVGKDAGGVSNSYAMNVSVSSSGGHVGGLVGYGAGGVSNSYAVLNGWSCTSSCGGLVGLNPGICSNSFWNNKTVDIQTDNCSGGSFPKSSIEMKNKTMFTDVGWNFVNVWDILSNVNTGYPYLRLNTTNSPTINVQSPLNQTYSTSTIYFNATADETIDTWIVNYNGTNTTLSSINTSLVVEDGSHHLLFYGNDSFGNWGLNDSIYFTIDTTSPVISFSCSPTSVYTGDVITCSCSATDNIDSSPTLSYTTNPDTSNTGTFTTTCTATDDANNSASSSIDYVVEERGASPPPIPPEDEEEIPENGNGNGGGGGSSGSSSSSGKLEEPKITIYVKLKQGETKTEEFTLTNIGTNVLNVSLNSDLEFLDFEKNLILNSEESKIVKVNISAKEDTTPYFYMGHIYATAPGIEKEVLVFVEVISKDSLFNVVLEAEKFVLPGEKVKANIFLERLNGFEEENITFSYLVKDIRGEDIVFENETMVVGDSLDFVKQIDIPQETRHGVYVFFVQVIDDEKIASDSDMFNVKFKEDRNWLLWVLVFILMVLGGIYIRNRIKEKKGK